VESAGQGHKALFYTADGHLFCTWSGPRITSPEEKDGAVGAGVKCIEWSRAGDVLAVSDYTANVYLLKAPSWSEVARVKHGMTVTPSETLKIWTEQLVPTANGRMGHVLKAASQVTAPPTRAATPPKPVAKDAAPPAPKTGMAAIALDHSGTLVATRPETLPTTVFVWDIASKLLKSVLILHSPILSITWHPSIAELLLVRCEGDDARGLAYLWEPSWDEPRIVDFGARLPEGKIMGRASIGWLDSTPSPPDSSEPAPTDSAREQLPALFFSDTQDGILAAVADPLDEDAALPWNEAGEKAVDIYGNVEESPLQLVAAPENGKGLWGKSAREMMGEEATITTFGKGLGDGEMDDTFHFKK
jgi:hypothetical protein